jgi:hypothetical protein
MQKFTIAAPDNISFEVIRAALAHIDAGIAVKPAQRRAKITAGASDDAPEYVGMEDMEYRRHCPKDTEGAVYCPESEKWYLPEVMDGVSVDKAIRKIMAEVRKGQNSDGRNKNVYPEFGTRRTESTEDYIRQFCGSLHHVSAEYMCGVTA